MFFVENTLQNGNDTSRDHVESLPFTYILPYISINVAEPSLIAFERGKVVELPARAPRSHGRSDDFSPFSGLIY